MKSRLIMLAATFVSFGDEIQRLRSAIDYIGKNRLDLARVFFVSVLVGCFTANTAAADPGEGTLFGLSGNSSTLLSIDTDTGVATTIGTLGFPPAPALARDPVSRTLYAGRGGGLPNIYTVAVTTGAATLVGNSGLGFAGISSLDFRSDGVLFAAVNIAGDGGTGADHLATIDTATGTATVIGSFGVCAGVPPLPVNGAGSCDLEGIEGIAFDSGGQLWGVKSTRGAAGSPGLYKINSSTGAAFFVGPLLDEFGDPASGGFVSMQFGCDGTTYLGSARAFGGGSDGGTLATIEPGGLASLTFTFANNPATSPTGTGSSLSALAFEDTCPPAVVTTVRDEPTPPGVDVPVITTEVLEQVAAEVIVAGTTNADFCVAPDPRELVIPGGLGGGGSQGGMGMGMGMGVDTGGGTGEPTLYFPRILEIAELSGQGSCTGPLVPDGEPAMMPPGGGTGMGRGMGGAAPPAEGTWEELLSQIDLQLAAHYRGYFGEFTLPGNSAPTKDVWLVVGVIRSTAEFNGPVAVINFPEALIDYSSIALANTPGCDRALGKRNLDAAAPVNAFGEFPNVEGNLMILETAQCNRSRSLTRRTTHVFPVRLSADSIPNREDIHIQTQFDGIRDTLTEAGACVLDSTPTTAMNASLFAAETAFALGTPAGYAAAEEFLEEVARTAKTTTEFTGCPPAANYRGAFMSRALSAAFTVHDRFEHAAAFVKYLVPADLEVPLLEPTIPIP